MGVQIRTYTYVYMLAAWDTSDEGERFRTKLWTKLREKWLSLTGRQAYTELLDDVQQSTSDELDDLLKVYRSDLNNACIKTDPIMGGNIAIKRDTYIYDGNLYFNW